MKYIQLTNYIYLFLLHLILEKLGLEEYFNLVQSYFVDIILPNVAGLLNKGESSPGNLLHTVEEEQDFIDMIKRIVV